MTTVYSVFGLFSGLFGTQLHKKSAKDTIHSRWPIFGLLDPGIGAFVFGHQRYQYHRYQFQCSWSFQKRIYIYTDVEYILYVYIYMYICIYIYDWFWLYTFFEICDMCWYSIFVVSVQCCHEDAVIQCLKHNSVLILPVTIESTLLFKAFISCLTFILIQERLPKIPN